MAGFNPQNVWEGAANDRISERIVANIFELPIVVADISDQNPNVMLELGLRLSSKKPTIVIANDDCTIPFDIKDFHAIFYPPDMNMLRMEVFFEKLQKLLQEKFRLHQKKEYQSFLSGVVVDVISPSHRQMSIEDAVLKQLNEISIRLNAMEKHAGTIVDRPQPTGTRLISSSRTKHYFTIPGDDDAVAKAFLDLDGVVSVELLERRGSVSSFAVVIGKKSPVEIDSVKVEMDRLCFKLGGTAGIVPKAS